MNKPVSHLPLGTLLKEEKELPAAGLDAARIALLADWNIHLLGPCVRRAAAEYGIDVSVYEGAYGQMAQEILQPESGLHQFRPSMIICWKNWEAVFGLDERNVFLTKTKMEEIGEAAYQMMIEQLLRLRTQHSASIVIHTLVKPRTTAFGPALQEHDASIQCLIDTFNTRLAEWCRTQRGCYLFDTERFLAQSVNAQEWCGPYRYLGDYWLAPSAFPQLGQAYLPFVYPAAKPTKKVLALDLDGTLWKGILGEDGPEGIEMGGTAAGKPHQSIQKYALALASRGIILAILSKNNEEDVWAVFREHPEMLIREQDVLASRINWQDKAQNLLELADELNVGIESFVLLDDDPGQRARVREALPGVAVLEPVTNDGVGLLDTLIHYPGFSSFVLTEEDLARTSQYQTERVRKQVQQTHRSYEEFLQDLGLTINWMPLEASLLPRAAQLTQKTNQFNLTTRRYTEEELEKHLSQGWLGWLLSIEDRFGEYGWTGLVLVDPKEVEKLWRIDTLLLSCRVLGKGIENAVLALLQQELSKRGSNAELGGEYIPSSKNKQTQDFYQKNGFVITETSTTLTRFQLASDQVISMPSHIQLKTSKTV